MVVIQKKSIDSRNNKTLVLQIFLTAKIHPLEIQSYFTVDYGRFATILRQNYLNIVFYNFDFVFYSKLQDV